MRRTALLTTAVATVASLAVLVPSAEAAGVGHRLTGVASCDQGGRAKLVTRVNAAGTEHGKVTVSGVHSKRWKGGLLLNPAAAYEDSSLNGSDSSATSGDATSTGGVEGPADPLEENEKTYVAKHGGFTAHAVQPGARTLSAMAAFTTPSLATCAITVLAERNLYAVIGVFDGILVRTGRHQVVQVSAMGEEHHHYRITVTVRTKAGTRHWNLASTAGSIGVVRASLHGIRRLSTFSEATVTFTDLSARNDSPETYRLLR